MKCYTWVVSLALLTGACVSRSTVPLGMPSQQYKQTNDRLAGHAVLVKYDDGRTIEMRNVFLRPDSATGATVLMSHGRVVTPLNRVLALEMRSRSKGALQGAAIGGLGFGLTLAALVVSLGSVELDWAAFKGGAANGLGWGAVIGGLRQARTIIDVQPAAVATAAKRAGGN